MAVVVLYFDKLNPFSKRKKKKQREMTIQLWIKVIIACVPAAVIGLLLDDWLDAHFYNYVTVSLMLILYGILFIVVENRNRFRRPQIERVSQMPYSTAALIGVFQVLALIPGTSRSGATILGGILLGASRYVATEFTFFLAIPVMFGASLLKIVKYGLHFTGIQVVIMLTGMVVAFIVSILAIKFLMGYIKKNDFKVFGYYRIILGAVVLIYFLIFG
jgi:undecaprenyl-diphosphatase